MSEHDADHAMAEFDRNARRAREAGRTIRSGAILVAVLLMAALWAGFMAPVPEAHSATRIRGKVDVCVMRSDTPKSWTRGLERAANREFRQRIDVRRIAEDRLGGCDVVVWTEGRTALNYLTGLPSTNPRYSVMTSGVFKIEINLGSVTPRRERRATLIQALREGGVR